ncbi:MAG: dienelactone hydrolase family protein, partial [Mycobacteriaceae bacterium]
MADDDLHDFERTDFTHHGKSRTVYRLGTGPAVIVMAEVPGITPKVLAFARRVASIGCTAVLPHLFGTPGRDGDPSAVGKVRAGAYLASTLIPLCVSREFVVLARGKTSPVVTWLRALAVDEHEKCGGP